MFVVLSMAETIIVLWDFEGKVTNTGDADLLPSKLVLRQIQLEFKREKAGNGDRTRR